MKKSYLKDLQSLLLGTVTDSSDALNHFSTDASIFSVRPQAVVYPQNTADIRKVVQFLYDRAERDPDKKLSLTARGLGTDLGGGALGEGLQLVLSAHMNNIIKLDGNNIVVQPGLLYRTLQETLQSHGRFLPPYPASIDYSTIGGAVANNASGEKTIKYGDTKNFVTGLKVVLSDGSIVETERISARELNRRKGRDSLEGKIYRNIDRIIDENKAEVVKSRSKTATSTSGYNLAEVKKSDGSFDLTPLFVGSQGTLGIITEVALKTSYYNPRKTLIVAFFDNLQKATDAITKLEPLHPSAMEFVDFHLLDFIRRHRPQDIEGLVPDNLPKLALLIEFDDASQLQQTIKSRRSQKVLYKYGARQRVSTDPVEQRALWKIRSSAAAVMWQTNGSKHALPFIEDGVVPPKKLHQLLTEVYKLHHKYDLEIALWGHAGSANIHFQPFLDLSKAKDVDKLFALTSEYAQLLKSLGGSASAGHNDGILGGVVLAEMVEPSMYSLFEEVKSACDPHNILNPNTKVGVDIEYARQHLRSEYSLNHLYNHNPHS